MVSQEKMAAVFMGIARAGALTTRHVIQRFGPKPNWQLLLDHHWLKEYQTPYGPVIALNVKGRELAQEKLVHVPYVAGPASVADRAYQNDALEVLTARGYTLHHHDYKKAGRVGKAAQEGRPFTDQILRSVVQVPPEQMRTLVIHWGPGVAYQPERGGSHTRAVGHPFLYASISSGGIKLIKLRALYQKHKAAIDSWRTPLLIAVPQEGDLRAFVRAVEAQHRRKLEKPERERRSWDCPAYSCIELIILPVPHTRGLLSRS